MKAVRIHQFGGPEVIRYEDAPDPTPGPGQAVVTMESIGVNFADVGVRRAGDPSALPLTLGREGAGTVSAIGQGVTGIAVGDRVGFCSVQGTYAEKCLAPADRLVKLGEGTDARTAAAALLQGMTAHYLVYSTYQLKQGDACLIHAGAGGMGLLLIQLAKRIGATAITTVSTEDKAKLAKEAGADTVINYTTQDFEEETKKATNGKGVQVVYDAVGKTTFDKSVACLAPRGMLALYGAASGPVPPVDLSIFAGRSLFLTRPGLPVYTATRDELMWRANDILGWIRAGELKLRIGHEFPLSEAAEAHRQLQGRETTGKVMLTP